MRRLLIFLVIARHRESLLRDPERITYVQTPEVRLNRETPKESKKLNSAEHRSGATIEPQPEMAGPGTRLKAVEQSLSRR